MRIATWNLCGGDKRAALKKLTADVVVLQERRKLDAGDDELWFGDSELRGLSVRASAGYGIRPIESPNSLPRYFVPLQVSGTERFQLIAVWAMPERPDWYVRGTVRAVGLWAERIVEQPTIIAGDFNANACWDHQHRPDRNFSALARRLGELGLVSAYHAFFGEELGNESRATFHLYRHKDRPFHLDYCFIPKSWLPRLRSVEVGSRRKWGKWSDHLPVIADLA